MKPTDEERREIANRLRTRRKEMESEKPPSNRLLAASVYLTNVGSAVRVGDDGNLFNRLADLIEPEERTCRIYDTDHGFEDSIRCDSCQMTFNRPWQPFKFCPNCGARVVGE